MDAAVTAATPIPAFDFRSIPVNERRLAGRGVGG
jgi:hypothetical protein